MKKKYLIFLASLFVCSGQANAEDFRFYGGAGFGFTQGDIEDEIVGLKFDADEKDHGFKIFGGYQINNSFAVEVYYADLGKLSAINNELALNGGKGDDIEIKLTGDLNSFGAAGVYSHSFSETFAIFGKLGLQRWKHKGDLSISAGGRDLDELEFSDGTVLEAQSLNDDGISFMTGAGVRANLLSSRLFLGGEFEWFDLEARHLMFSAHAGVRF
jgi:OOP family OmpA-OmpF porin